MFHLRPVFEPFPAPSLAPSPAWAYVAVPALEVATSPVQALPPVDELPPLDEPPLVDELPPVDELVPVEAPPLVEAPPVVGALPAVGVLAPVAVPPLGTALPAVAAPRRSPEVPTPVVAPPLVVRDVGRRNWLGTLPLGLEPG